MKLYFISAIMVGLFFSTSCNRNGHSSVKECDSIAIAMALLNRIDSLKFGLDGGVPERYKMIFERMKVKSFFSASSVPNPKSEAEVRAMHLQYLDNPLEIYWEDEH